jgi:hypothetical protein
MRHKMKLWITAAAVSAASMAALAPASQATTVCNQAENSPRDSGLVAKGPVDPNPPARHTTGIARVGNDKAKGLVKAAANSPALTECGPPDDGSGPTGPGGGGGDDGGGIVIIS